MYEFDGCLADTDIECKTLDIKALTAACTQKIAPGKSLKLDFDLFPAASFSKSVSVVSITTDPFNNFPTSAFPTIITPPSVVSTIIISTPLSYSTVTAATTQATANPDKALRLGLVVGLAAAVVVAILAISGLIYRWVADNNARQQKGRRRRCLPDNGIERVELDNSLVLEADDGKPRLELPLVSY